MNVTNASFSSIPLTIPNTWRFSISLYNGVVVKPSFVRKIKCRIILIEFVLTSLYKFKIPFVSKNLKLLTDFFSNMLVIRVLNS